jgi:hypothetical protein
MRTVADAVQPTPAPAPTPAARPVPQMSMPQVNLPKPSIVPSHLAIEIAGMGIAYPSDAVVPDDFEGHVGVPHC